MRVTRAIVVVALVPLIAGFFFEPLLAPKAELWPRWQTHQEASTVSIDHGAWEAFLERYVSVGDDGINRLAYAEVRDADRNALVGYIEKLAGAAVSDLNRTEQKAYWINLYNALTVRVVLDHHPVDSIRDIDISDGLLADGPWKKKLLTIESESVSLDDIEHRILRPIWRDARLHYALNCAAVSCPNLQTRAFTSANTDALLEAAARAYVNHPRGVDAAPEWLLVSSIYVWFKADFGGSADGVLAHLKKYAEPELARRLGGFREINNHHYDWALNRAGS
jgi:hypothetical protein